MSDQTNGLRFDVYERVHLPDDVAAIEELEEIELVPRIQVIDQGDQAVLKGQLLLTGVYRGQNGGDEPLALEHFIPVEITLPMNRISRLDDISIEIDNFDVDLLSARTLNITGVLSLRGIASQPAEELEEVWREEPFTVIHQREAYEPQSEAETADQLNPIGQPYIAEEAYQAAETKFAVPQWPESSAEAEPSVTVSSASADNGWMSSQFFASNDRQEQEEAEASAGGQEQEITLASQQTSDEGWLKSSSFAEVSPSELSIEEPAAREPEPVDVQEGPFFAAVEPEQREEQDAGKQELRIALSGKQPDETAGTAPNVGLSTLLQTSKREQAARQAADEVEAQAQAQELEDARTQASGDEIEWKNLFLGKRSEDQEFRKIRMCIVQRDETLDVIASRYSLNPREILIYNRLDEGSVSEGQLLYIP